MFPANLMTGLSLRFSSLSPTSLFQFAVVVCLFVYLYYAVVYSSYLVPRVLSYQSHSGGRDGENPGNEVGYS